MRTTVIVMGVVLAACSSDGTSGGSGSNGAAGTSGQNGAAGSTGAAGAAGQNGAQGPQGERGPAGPAGPAGEGAAKPKSGSRLKVLVTVDTSADGSEVTTAGGYQDTARGDEVCIVGMAADGQRRCLPVLAPAVGASLVWQAGCTAQMAMTATPLAGGVRSIFAAECTAGSSECRYHVFSAAAPITSNQVCTKPADGCTCRGPQPGETYYATEIPASDFAAITRVTAAL